MMLAPTIKQLIRQDATALGVNPDYVYSYSIDPDVRAHDTEHLVMLVTEISDTPHDYGSNKSLNRRAEIQIQIFIPQTYDGDTGKLRYQVAKLLEDHDWYCMLDTGIEEDPSADILVNTMRWEKTH